VPLPDYERVIYERNPLTDVICQLRFPPVLRIDVDLPAAFQDAIRGEFPILTEKSAGENGLAIPPEIAREIPPQFAQQLGALQGKKSYSFASDDGAWTIVLARDSLALTSKRYREWPEFLGRLRPAVEALVANYQPSHYSRVGLRYSDLICRSSLGLADVPWSDLLQPYIAGELGSEAVSSEITLAARQLVIALPEHRGQVLVQHGLGTKEGAEETCYVIDADYSSSERTEVNDVWGLLEGLHGQAGRLFRWCIRDRLHDALQPRVPA
jgi:uncharacterized protein (TIGR04255 family)